MRNLYGLVVYLSCIHGAEVVWILLSPQAPSIFGITDKDPTTRKQKE